MIASLCSQLRNCIQSVEKKLDSTISCHLQLLRQIILAKKQKKFGIKSVEKLHQSKTKHIKKVKYFALYST